MEIWCSRREGSPYFRKFYDKKGKINEAKFLSEKDEEETDDNNENYKDKEEIIFNDDYAFT